MRQNDDEEIQRITNAPESLDAAQKHRMRVYGLQMVIRVICLILAFVVTGPLRWIFIAGAILLPYSAVLFANAGRDSRQTQVPLLDPRLIESRPNTRTEDPDSSTEGSDGTQPGSKPGTGAPRGPQPPRTEN